MFLVTVKLPKNPEHNPRAKITGPCPVTGLECTDVTGAHHTVLARDRGAVDVLAADHHITRVEEVPS